jgi:hypothetical protein
MSARQTQPTISDVRLERYRLGELEPGEREAIAVWLAGDPALRSRLAALEQSDREIAAAHPPRDMAGAIARRVRASASSPGQGAQHGFSRVRPPAWLVPAGVVATCVCVAAVAASVWLWRPAGDDTTIKGGESSLVMYRRVGDRSEELSRGALVRPGDQVRVGYRASGRAYGVILSIDGRGNLTQHLPKAGGRSAALQPSGTVFLDFAYELDDAPRWEAFYFVTSDAPFDLEPIRRAVREAAISGRSPETLALPRGFMQFLFPLSKEPR